MIIEISCTVAVNAPANSYLQQFICELSYAPGKVRPEIFWLPRDTQLNTTIPVNNQFIRVIDRVSKEKTGNNIDAIIHD